MANARGTIEKQLSILEAKFSNDRKVLGILARIAEKVHTHEDITILETFFRRLYFAANLSGYTIQSQLLALPLSPFGTQEASKYAINKSSTLVKTYEQTLQGKPQIIPYVRHFVEHSTVTEGFKDGQKTSAVEHSLKFKTWIRTAQPAVGPAREHSNLEGKTIPADGLFTIPTGEQVEAPHDWSIANPAAEWVNCYHAIIYTQGATREDLLRNRN